MRIFAQQQSTDSIELNNLHQEIGEAAVNKSILSVTDSDKMEVNGSELHRQRSEFIRKLVQRDRSSQHSSSGPYGHQIPRTIVQYWHDLQDFPNDVGECVGSWARWETSGFRHRLFDEYTAKSLIRSSLGPRYESAFERCYHPAMQADYFRLCYLFVEGGCYVDADDVCIGSDIDWLFEDGRLKLQPLCYDIASGKMIPTSTFLPVDTYEPSWIFYFNNNPLVASRGHRIVECALAQSTTLIERICDDTLSEIQETTGPGNLSRSIFDLGSTSEAEIESDLMILRSWDSIAVSRWPLSYRDDARNWRLSNQKRFIRADK